MILEMKPMSTADVIEQLKDNDEKQELREHLTKFVNIAPADAAKLSEDLRALDNLKVKEEHIVKIIDFLPKDAEDLHKIFSDVSLDEQEVQGILTLTQSYGK